MDKIKEMQDQATNGNGDVFGNTEAARAEAERVASELSEPQESPSEALGDKATGIRTQAQLEREIRLMQSDIEMLKSEKEQLKGERDIAVSELGQYKEAISILKDRLNQSHAAEATAWREAHMLRQHLAASQNRVQELTEQAEHGSDHVH